ncbi:hypothetical protein NPS01_07660 [Nocardioides psychrotolerans]|uniref:ATP-grasp domain-containing protein n=1 Tax=Nocardioides psychrotolerans TaxID=1005945 RepID=A0A1I3DA05_9ACTN|nr:hypothetical protein [Nocardioides psychrotolerans]GEP37103.1 hypothetical protein NPS01_07660 [Nocardioides psychrotolerans]SFH83567.1 hypothetical protein SAMN05216561_102416 [Nocardioides psychrotolerans]
MDLSEPAARAAVTARLARPLAGRPVVIGPTVLAGATSTIDALRGLGCPVLVVATARGAGPVPDDPEVTVVEIAAPEADSVTDELRLLDRTARELPPGARAAVEAFDPDRHGVWWCGLFVTTDEPIDGRPVAFGRPAAFIALEDKMLSDGIWAGAGVDHPPYAIVANDPDSLAAATEELAGPLGAVWSGDARDGFNGAGNYVRWVVDERDQAGALAYFRPRCDRVRVQPFLEGVPCSIHGFVLPDGTAALRPVEIATLRDIERRRLVFGGVGTTWDPPPADREAMRDVVRRVGAHLASAHGYRGAFGIDGVLTAEGFLPTELNPRMSAGATVVADLESLVPLMDADRAGKPSALSRGPAKVGRDVSFRVRWDGRDFARTDEETGDLLVAGDTPTGFFAKVEPCASLVRGIRLGDLTAGLMRFADREWGADFGAVEAAPDVRR